MYSDCGVPRHQAQCTTEAAQRAGHVMAIRSQESCSFVPAAGCCGCCGDIEVGVTACDRQALETGAACQRAVQAACRLTPVWQASLVKRFGAGAWVNVAALQAGDDACESMPKLAKEFCRLMTLRVVRRRVFMPEGTRNWLRVSIVTSFVIGRCAQTGVLLRWHGLLNRP